MIFPLLKGFPLFNRKYIVTWFLFLLNLNAFIFTSLEQKQTEKDFAAIFSDPLFSQSQAIAYSQYIRRNSNFYGQTLNTLSDRALSGESKSLRILSQFAIRDANFLKSIEKETYVGDEVAFQHWKNKTRKLASLQEASVSYQFGLSYFHRDWWNWISYQFLHAGYLHLLANMLFLLIFGACLEPLMGSASFLTVYLVCGVTGASVFSYLTGLSGVPLIGASGAVSGLMGFFVLYYQNKPMRFLYWLLPSRHYSGIIYLPAYVCFFIWLLSDLAGYMSLPNELGGVAYTAHLGGAFAGALFALPFFFWRKATS